MKILFAAALAFALTGCARGLLADDPVDPQQVAASEAAADAALDAVISCTEPKVAYYASAPDAAADVAADVAAAIVGACNAPVTAYANSVERTCGISLRGNVHAARSCAALKQDIRSDLQQNIANRVVQQRAKQAAR